MLELEVNSFFRAGGISLKVLTNGNSELTTLSINPSRLAQWLMEVQYKFALMKNHLVQPVLVAAHDSVKERSLLVAVSPLNESFQRNGFGKKFLAATKAVEGQCAVRLDLWDSASVEVGKKNFSKFWKALLSG